MQALLVDGTYTGMKRTLPHEAAHARHRSAEAIPQCHHLLKCILLHICELRAFMACTLAHPTSPCLGLVVVKSYAPSLALQNPSHHLSKGYRSMTPSSAHECKVQATGLLSHGIVVSVRCGPFFFFGPGTGMEGEASQQAKLCRQVA